VQQGGKQFVTVEDSMGVVGSSRGTLKPASPHLRSEPAIIAGMAKATLGAKPLIDWDAYVANYDLIRDKIEAVIPGFPSFNDRIREGTFYLPNPPRDERKFETPSKKAVFIPHPITRPVREPGQYLLTSVRSHDQFNTSIYGLDDRYRGIYNGRRVAFMNEDDMREGGFVQGQLVDLISHFNGKQRRADAFMVAPYPIPRRCVATYYPEANVLVPIDSVADQSNCPASKTVPITIEPSAARVPVTEDPNV
jgi:anaerobic selenocysteine-containing dehydrogenase